MSVHHLTWAKSVLVKAEQLMGAAEERRILQHHKLGLSDRKRGSFIESFNLHSIVNTLRARRSALSHTQYQSTPNHTHHFPHTHSQKYRHPALRGILGRSRCRRFFDTTQLPVTIVRKPRSNVRCPAVIEIHRTMQATVSKRFLRRLRNY